MPEVKLKKPIVLDGNKIKVIKLDLEGLTGADVLAVENDLRNQQTQFGIFSQATQTAIAAKAAKMIPDDLQKLSMHDFLEVNGYVQLFLLGQELETENPSDPPVLN